MHIHIITTTKFLRIFINETLSWKTYIDYITPKLSTTYYDIRIIKPYMSQNNLRMAYFSYFHATYYELWSTVL
jgi:hypothetical protein